MCFVPDAKEIVSNAYIFDSGRDAQLKTLVFAQENNIDCQISIYPSTSTLFTYHLCPWLS